MLLKPKLYSLRHRWHRGGQSGRLWARDVIILSLTATMMVGTYLGGLWALQQTKTQLDFAYFHPSLSMGLVFVFLLLMLFITNLVSALSALFMGKDLETILSSPLSPIRFFLGKFVEVLFTSSWMTMVFILPLILAFGVFYQASATYYLLALFVLIPFFIIPASSAVVFALLFARLFPASRKRELLLLTLSLLLYGVYLLARLLSSSVEQAGTIDMLDIAHLVSFLSLPNTIWSPSYWTANVLGELLEPTGKNFFPHIRLLYSTAISIFVLAFLILRFSYFSAYSKSSANAQAKTRSGKRVQARLRYWSPFLSGPSRAIISKEFRCAARDLTQSFQMLLLLGLSALYLYMLKLQQLFHQVLPAEDQSGWRIMLLVVNSCLEAFVVTSIGTRLVFPSISREAQAFWMLQSAPVSLRSILRTKWHCWWIPIALITSVVFGLAAYMFYDSIWLMAFKAGTNIVLVCGLVGMGMGFGAYFAEFDWEHPSQLTTGFGSLVYMVAAVVLIAMNLFITGCVISFSYINVEALKSGNLLATSLVLSCILGIVALNYTAAIVSLKMGEQGLEQRY